MRPRRERHGESWRQSCAQLATTPDDGTRRRHPAGAEPSRAAAAGAGASLAADVLDVASPPQVYRAICKSYNEEVAVKLLDLENMNCSLDEIVREAQVCVRVCVCACSVRLAHAAATPVLAHALTSHPLSPLRLPSLLCSALLPPPRASAPRLQTMRQLNHPNLLPLYCSFVHKEHLWMVMPYVQGGSVLNIMRFAYPDVRRAGGRAGVWGGLTAHFQLHYGTLCTAPAISVWHTVW